MSSLPKIPGVRYLISRAAVSSFFELARTRQLLFPAVVVTRSAQADHPFIPLAELYEAVSDVADVYFLDGPVQVRDVVPASSLNDLNVYGGATRVFPAGDWKIAAVFTARDRDEGHRRIGAITSHLQRLRGSSSHHTESGSSRPTPAADLRIVELEAENAALQSRINTMDSADRSRPKPKSKLQAPRDVPLAPSARRLFVDVEDEIRYRVMVQWAERTTPQQKEESPLPRYALGPSFAASVEAITEHSPTLLDKIARAMLRVLIGQDRDGHKLDPQGRPREDGAVCWRTYVEQNTASARRLHFWRVPGGTIEFSRVGLHDDYTP